MNDVMLVGLVYALAGAVIAWIGRLSAVPAVAWAGVVVAAASLVVVSWGVFA